MYRFQVAASSSDTRRLRILSTGRLNRNITTVEVNTAIRRVTSNRIKNTGLPCTQRCEDARRTDSLGSLRPCAFALIPDSAMNRAPWESIGRDRKVVRLNPQVIMD